jgi:hypothetical protein
LSGLQILQRSPVAGSAAVTRRLKGLELEADIHVVLNSRAGAILSIVVGIGLELGVQALGARREAWDSPAFWTIGMPLALVIAFVIGVRSTGRAWLTTFAIAPAQFATMTVRSGEVGSLWPLGLILSAALSTPFVVASFAGARVAGALRRRTQGR